MTRLKLLFVLLFVNTLISCDKDNDDLEKSTLEARALNSMIMDGEWKVSQFMVNGTDEAPDYQDYVFVFEENNNLEAEAAIESVQGTWRVNNDSGGEFDSYYDVDFHIFFQPSAKLAKLAHNYNVIYATETEVRLQLEGPEDNNDIFLSFKKK